MKKRFSLLCALLLLFLTSCNTVPPTGTTGSGASNGGMPNNGQNGEIWQDAFKDQVISASSPNDLIDISSRIIFEGTLAGAGAYGGNLTYTCYYSKADEKAYIYCFDPLCDHKDCMADPGNDMNLGWKFNNTLFYENRFYSLTTFGQILSFSFDGTDRKIEYDLGYEAPTDGFRSSVWYPGGLYGPYLYIGLKMDQSGFECHTLRFNLETKEMEDLTEKTGNYISPYYFYNGMIYGNGIYSKTGDAFLRADLDLNTVEILDAPAYLDQSAGSMIVGDVYQERSSIEELPVWIGISFYNIETGDKKILSGEDFGVERPAIIYATDEHFYFYNEKIIDIGTITVNRGDKEQKWTVQKMNDGKLYRMNLDGTDIICVYDNPAYELSENMIIYGDKVVMQGRYIGIENGEKKIWGGALQVADINPDGTFGEFREVEIVG